MFIVILGYNYPEILFPSLRVIYIYIYFPFNLQQRSYIGCTQILFHGISLYTLADNLPYFIFDIFLLVSIKITNFLTDDSTSWLYI